MEKSNSIGEITKATIAVMKSVKGIEKSMTVGSGSNSYKGVSDKDVKNAIGKIMEENGLAIFPIEVEPTLQIDRWEEVGGQYGPKQKQSVFASVKTKYLLSHVSGEWIEVSGYGHGTDTQDKAAGKATTYALKYALLYIFMVPTGKIDDADVTHSDELDVAPKALLPQEKEIADAIKEMSNSANMDQLKECWTKWKKFQKEPGFMAKKEEMKNKISQLKVA